MKQTVILTLLAVASATLSVQAQGPQGLAAVSEDSAACLKCHKDLDPGIYQQWGESRHFRANVACYECHRSAKGEPDAFEHFGKFIATIVSPKDCAACHKREVDEFASSHHSKGGRILGSLDNRLAEVVEGNKGFKTEGFPEGNAASAVSGCWQCHGSVIKVLDDGKLDPATWPNTGIGRINPDGSEGSCKRLPRPPFFLRRTGPASRQLRQVPHGPGPSAEGNLLRIQARHRVLGL